MKGHVPAINIDHYLRAQKPKRTIRAKQFEDFVKKNIVERSVCNNNQCFKQLPAKTEQFRNSFFVRTTHDWNILSDNIVNCDTVESFRTLIAKKDEKFAHSTPLNKSQDWLLQRTIQIQILCSWTLHNHYTSHFSEEEQGLIKQNFLMLDFRICRSDYRICQPLLSVAR